MEKKTLIILFTLFAIAFGKHEIRHRVLEVFWESYLAFPNDYDSCNNDAEIIVDNDDSGLSATVEKLRLPPGSILNVAFASSDFDSCRRRFKCREFVCGLQLYEGVDDKRFENFVEEIRVVRSRFGVVVVLAFEAPGDGENTDVPIKTTQVVDLAVEYMVEAVRVLGVDGLNLVQKAGCGTRNLKCGDLSSIHLYFLERLRTALPDDKRISYTFPSGNFGINFPFSDVIKYGEKYVDSFTYFGIGSIASWNVLPQNVSKVIRGFPIGNDDFFGNVSSMKALEFSREAIEADFGGVSVWSVNKDDVFDGDFSRDLILTLTR